MSNYFIYSVLQYKHSLALGEILNVGILFYFPADVKFEFVTCDATRAKLIYPDFNNSLYGSYFFICTNQREVEIESVHLTIVQSYFDLVLSYQSQYTEYAKLKKLYNQKEIFYNELEQNYQKLYEDYLRINDLYIQSKKASN